MSRRRQLRPSSSRRRCEFLREQHIMRCIYEGRQEALIHDKPCIAQQSLLLRCDRHGTFCSSRRTFSRCMAEPRGGKCNCFISTRLTRETFALSYNSIYFLRFVAAFSSIYHQSNDTSYKCVCDAMSTEWETKPTAIQLPQRETLFNINCL